MAQQLEIAAGLLKKPQTVQKTQTQTEKMEIQLQSAASGLKKVGSLKTKELIVVKPVLATQNFNLMQLAG